MKNQEIHWNEAIERKRKKKEIDARAEEERLQNLELAKEQLWNQLGSPDFRASHFSEICDDYGLDEDDLLDTII